MNIYFYCSYENSQKGFYPTCFTGNGLSPADGSMGITLPEMVKSFLYYDRFLILWRGYSNNPGSGYLPNLDYEFLGVRDIHGLISGRKGTANIVFAAWNDEISLLRRLAMYSIENFRSFSNDIMSMLSIGGPCSYEINAQVFNNWLHSEKNYEKKFFNPKKAESLLRSIPVDRGMYTERELFRFAVCKENWSSVAPFMGREKFWRKQPKTAVSYIDYLKIFSAV